jgi:hypothetical protein
LGLHNASASKFAPEQKKKRTLQPAFFSEPKNQQFHRRTTIEHRLLLFFQGQKQTQNPQKQHQSPSSIRFLHIYNETEKLYTR